MADSWLTHAEYLTYGYEVISEEEFPQLVAKATLQIMEATHWRAAAAKDEACIKALRDCEALLLSDAAARAQTTAASGGGAVTSSNNDGYSESYASAADLRKEATLRDRETIRQALGAPATSWMLYAGGTYHPPARR